MNREINNSRSVLFVCTGNICRSPLAEVLLRNYAKKKGAAHRLKVSSAGTYALNGNAATWEAQQAAASWGLDLSGHRAREVSRSIMADSDFVLGMTKEHCRWLVREFPEHENKIYLALLFPRKVNWERLDGIDVPDPIGQSVRYYAEVLEMLSPALPRIFDNTFKEEGE